jgi:hypothetical protein
LWFQSKVSWIHFFEPEGRQNIMVVGVYSGGDCSHHDSLAAKKETKEEYGDRIYLSKALPQ